MNLTGNEKPDFRTICNFKRECKELIEEVFKETVTIAKALGIPELGHISTDGTKMKANVSNNYTLSEEEIEGIERANDKRLKSAAQNAVSLSDPEARFMENKKKRKELSYNSQITVDHAVLEGQVRI